ncbi:MAG: ThiF family adenylyltransferase [Psychrobacillus sp.]
MGDSIIRLETELYELGFSKLEENRFLGKVPYKAEYKNTCIDVEIIVDGYPFKQPKIILKSINGDLNIYKVMPHSWRHIDECSWANPTMSVFYICCLHNWSAKAEAHGRFIYQRIFDWLKCNVEGEWNVSDDLPSYRIIPQISFAFNTAYISNQLLDRVTEKDVPNYFGVKVYHERWQFKDGAKSKRNENSEGYDFNSINFNVKNSFYIAMEVDDKFNDFIRLKELDKKSISNGLYFRITEDKFKTIYQLIELIRKKCDFRRLDKKIKTLIIIVSYVGDRGNDETIAFITDRNQIAQTSAINLVNLSIDSFIKRSDKLNLNIGLLGVGSLGSQVAQILVNKDIDKIIIADYDNLNLQNLNRHVLGSIYVGGNKAASIKKFYELFYLADNIITKTSDEEVANDSDILVVTVGNPQSFDLLAFNTLLNYKKPIIWCWTSPHNILMEIVVTTPYTGCLNCYYELIKEDEKLKELQAVANTKISELASNELDICGNPHTISQIEKMIFLATQIVSIISSYSKTGDFRMDYINYYWKDNEVLPVILSGYLPTSKNCGCSMEGL